MLISWLRRDHWVLGFGPLPIVLSTNLFLWFKDDWFYYQFALMAAGVLGKQFLRWHREGRLTHIFNPSAFSAFVVSVALITLSAAATLLLLNLSYTHFTGIYHTIDSGIPVAVFIGLRLLVTD